MANHKPMKRKCRKRKNKVTKPYARRVVAEERYPAIEELVNTLLNPFGYINWSSRG